MYAAGNPRQELASGAKYVEKLKSDLTRKQNLYKDDLTFIAEVKTGSSPAPGMDPDQELKTLRRRFESFKRDFKASCSTCVESLLI